VEIVGLETVGQSLLAYRFLFLTRHQHLLLSLNSRSIKSPFNSKRNGLYPGATFFVPEELPQSCPTDPALRLSALPLFGSKEAPRETKFM
jgi:hypothetical protein